MVGMAAALMQVSAVGGVAGHVCFAGTCCSKTNAASVIVGHAEEGATLIGLCIADIGACRLV
jgi:hypothetical protein